MRRWLIRVGGGLLGLIVILALAGVIYQAIGTTIDSHNYPPLGKLVDVGGYHLHLYCTGEGSPTVVLDAMGNGWSLYWSTVQPEVAKLTRVCSYDRAGSGWSEPGPTPRTGQQIANAAHFACQRWYCWPLHTGGTLAGWFDRPLISEPVPYRRRGHGPR